MVSAALAGLTVVECGQGLAGAFAAKAFADLGADVIKVEPPDGDAARAAGPFPGDVPHPERSGQFLYLNANKRGVTLDLDSAGGLRLLGGLLGRADLLITDLPPARLDGLGLDYASLRDCYPRLIATAISPFGQTGPYRDYQGGDLIAWHMGGTGYGTPFNAVTDPETQPPLRGGGYQAEYLAGWTAATAAMLAVLHRERTGSGQLVDISAQEAVANMVRAGFSLYSYDRAALPASRLKAASPWIYPCKDGYISTSTLRDHWWEALKDLMGRPAWSEVACFGDVPGRRQNADALDALLGEWFAEHTRADLYRMLVERGIPCFPLNTIADLMESAHYRARDFFVVQQHPIAGAITQPGPAIRFSATPWQLRRPAPLHGQHHQEIFGAPASPQAPAAASGDGMAAGRPDPRTAAAADQPLRGIRILDFGWILSVPHCTAWLGSLGAEVIRVESAMRLDMSRAGVAGGADGIPGVNRSSAFNGLNYSKQSLTLNLATEQGRALARELAAISDVVTENFATGVMDRMGLGYAALRAIKPDIVMLTGSTLGTTGPEREASGWGPNVGAYAGLPSLTGYRDGGPVDLGGIWPDYMIGTMMAFAVLSALRHRDRTGEGQHIEVAMGEAVTAMIPEAVLEYTMNGRQRPRMGNRDPRMAPHEVYPCQGEDAWVAIAVAGDREWQALCHAIGQPALAADARFRDVRGRLEHHDVIDEIVSAWTRRHTPVAVMHTLQAAGVAAGPVMSIADLMDDPHLRSRGFAVEMDHPEVGRRTVAGLPAHFSAIPAPAYGPAPCLGEHNEQILCGLLHRSREEVQALVAAKVVC